MTGLYENDSTVLDVPQQILAGYDVDRITEARLGRSCLVHCVDAARELFDGPKVGRRADLISFILEHGHETGSDLYNDGEGWITTKIAQLLRLEGHPVIVQNPLISEKEYDKQKSEESLRAKSDLEHKLLKRYAKYGSKEKSTWFNSIMETTALGGSATVTITIPLLSGGFGAHTVLVTDISDKDEVIFFDPDLYYAGRYTSKTVFPDGIKKVDEASPKLFYQQPKGTFSARMEPNIMHILPAE